MIQALMLCDISLCAKEPSDEVESRLKAIPNVFDVEYYYAGSSDYGLKMYVVADYIRTEENIEAIRQRIWDFFKNHIHGVSPFRVSLINWVLEPTFDETVAVR